MPFKSPGDAQKANVQGKREVERDGKPFNEGKEERRSAIECDAIYRTRAKQTCRSLRAIGIMEFFT